ncbi:MAG: ATP-binding cassette domain-containing protein [Anaerolineales bacterium]|nr:ATP-binding cassette domain-containing protein [Anaerolineales bacterium]MCB9126641.1 ATP-binding cassette domain-containing protein [Ardenticatenales bacterium]MCB9172733.1 ATP-binding cassette domain-containing protein [Ardenticatenales bacterium]
MLQATSLTARYPESETVSLTLPGFQLKAGAWQLLCGGNGSGKSTLLLALAGAFTRHLGGTLTGELSVEGLSLQGTAWDRWLTQITLLPQENRHHLSGARETVAEELAFPLENRGWPRAAMQRRIADLLDDFALHRLAHRDPTTLSGGEQQRVALAATLALRPRYLLLDEPLASLDPASQRSVLALLEALHRDGTTLLTATVDVADFATRCAASTWLHHGALQRHGPSRDMVSDPRLAALGVVPPRMTWLAQRAALPAPWPLTLDEAVVAFRKPTGTAASPHDAPALALPPALASPTPTEVRLASVTFAYNDGPPVLRDLTATLAAGRITALIGANGAGKSTLARTLNGLLRPQRGTVALNGRPIAHRPTHQLAAQVGILFQAPLDQLFNPTVEAEVAFAPRQLGFSAAQRHERMVAALAVTGLAAQAHVHPYDLSAVEQRWVALASILAQGASVLVLDEPARGMDFLHRQRLVALLRALRDAGHTLLLISHDMSFVGELADRVLHLVDGQLEFDGPAEDFFPHAPPDLQPPVTQLAKRLGFPPFVREREFLHHLTPDPSDA